MSRSLVGTYGMQGSGLWNKQNIEGGDTLPKVEEPLRSEFYQSSWLP